MWYTCPTPVKKVSALDTYTILSPLPDVKDRTGSFAAHSSVGVSRNNTSELLAVLVV